MMKLFMMIPMAVLSLLVASCVEDPGLPGCGDTVLSKTATSSASCAPPEYDFWQTYPPLDYSFKFARQCFCTEETVGPFFVTVRDGFVISVSRRTFEGDTVAVISNLYSYSLGSIWLEVEAALADSNSSEFARYDSIWGFPDSVYIDRIQMAIDDEYGMTVTEFSPLIRAD